MSDYVGGDSVVLLWWRVVDPHPTRVEAQLRENFHPFQFYNICIRTLTLISYLRAGNVFSLTQNASNSNIDTNDEDNDDTFNNDDERDSRIFFTRESATLHCMHVGLSTAFNECRNMRKYNNVSSKCVHHNIVRTLTPFTIYCRCVDQQKLECVKSLCSKN